MIEHVPSGAMRGAIDLPWGKFRVSVLHEESGAWIVTVAKPNEHGGYSVYWLRAFPNWPAAARVIRQSSRSIAEQVAATFDRKLPD